LGDDTEAACVGELAELEVLEDAVDFGNDVLVNGSENGRPESGVGPLNNDGIGVVTGSVAAGGGSGRDEPSPSAADARSATMPKTDAAPIPFCRLLTFM
jgi:hypothetical protein